MDKNLQEMLNNLSAEELEVLSSLLSKTSKKPKKKRRGRGKRKKKSENTTPKESPDFLKGIRLNAEEQKEFLNASEFDKEKGLDKPKSGGIMPKGPTFEKVSIPCRVCGKVFEVSPALVPPEKDRFKCNKCSCSAG